MTQHSLTGPAVDSNVCFVSASLHFTVALLVTASLAGSLQAEITVSSEFVGGSGDVRRIDQDAVVIHIHPSLHPGRGWPCWWYVRIDGLPVGGDVSLQLSANPREFKKGSRLARVWSQPDRAAISIDNQNWRQTSPYRQLDEGVVEYRFAAPAQTVWMAWGPPFLPSHAETLLSRVSENLPDAQRFVLAKTRHQRDVNAIRITDADSDFQRRAVWVQARQHAWESGSSWVGRGFIEWAAGQEPAAVSFRRTTDIYFVPIMDVDNVTSGAGGKEATPRDHNRDWSDRPHYPEVAAAQQLLRRIDSTVPLVLFIDLHNPGKNDRQPYFYGPINLKQLSPHRQRRYATWMETAASKITAPMRLVPQYRFATYIRTEEERSRVSRTWVENHTGATAITFETAWDTPHSTIEGYQIVGAQLGKAIAEYVSQL